MRTVRPIRLLFACAAALTAAGCEDSSLPYEPEVPAPVVAAAGDGASLAGPRWASGYALASSPLLPSYDLSGTGFSYNQSGGAIIITKPAGTTGRYIATFAGLSALLGRRSTVLVNAYSSGVSYCKPVQGYLANDKVEVRCFDAATKAPVNVGFNVIVFGGATDPAFAFAHQPKATNYSPSAAGSFNPPDPRACSATASAVTGWSSTDWEHGPVPRSAVTCRRARSAPASTTARRASSGEPRT